MQTSIAVRLLISSILILTIFSGCRSANTSESRKDKIPENPNVTVNTKGNTNGNLINDGRFALQGNWIYYLNSDDGGLYKMKTDGTLKTKLLGKSKFPNYLNVEGEWIYYIDYNNGMLEKVKIDGKEKTSLNISTYYINVVGNWIYYLNQADAGIYKIKTDGTEKTILNGRSSGNIINVEGDWVYYLDGLPSSLMKIKTDGTEKTTVVVSTEFGDRFITEGEWIYYLNHNDEFKPYKMKIDGTKKTKLSNDSAANLNVSGNWIYYGDRDGMNFPGFGKFYRVKTDGTKRTKLGHGFLENISVFDDWIYYSEYKINRGKSLLYKMKTDGTKMTVLN